MLYKEDWEQAKQRFLAWWNGEIIDRIALQVRAPRKSYRPRPLAPPLSLEARWTLQRGLGTSEAEVSGLVERRDY